MKTNKIKWKFPEREESGLSVHIEVFGYKTLCGLDYTGNGTGSIVEDKSTWQGFIQTDEKVTCMFCQQLLNFCRNITDIEIPEFDENGIDYKIDFASDEMLSFR